MGHMAVADAASVGALHDACHENVRAESLHF
jgi:hypothetical protein